MIARMTQADQKSVIAGSLVGQLVNSDVGNISTAASKFATVSSSGSAAEKKAYQENEFKRNYELKKRQIAEAQAKFQQVNQKHTSMSEALRALQEKYSKTARLNARIQKEIDKLAQLETPENTKDIQMLKSLVFDNESLKTQEAAFKASCKKQKADLEKKIEELKKAEPTEEESERKRRIAETYQSDLVTLQQMKQRAAIATREIQLLERKIDEIPGRSELQQYQRQFVELYEQIASKLVETRQYYTSYNTLDDTRNFLSKESSILLSVQENYKPAMSSKSNRDKFLDSLQTILKSVNQNLEKTLTKLTEEKANRDKLNENYIELVERERAFAKATKEFQEECRKNELLQQKITGA